MNKTRIPGKTLGAVLIAVMGGIAAVAYGAERSGKDVVYQVCANCHSTGVNGAPKIGDKEAWSKRAARGLSSLTQNALTGIRKMPAHGGQPNVSDSEVRRAITYMVNQSGGNWIEPIDKSAKPGSRTGEQIVKMQCAKCHEEGLSGAPKIDDRAAWAPRMKQGLDATVRSAAHGHGAMPARGGLADVTDSELRAAILYMFYPAGAALKPREPSPGVRDATHKRVGGLDIYLGVAPAANAPVEQKGPRGRGYYYLNISLHEANTNAFIKDAQVEARAANAVTGGETKKLAPVTINNSPSYGNFFRMEGKEPYAITVRVHRPGDDGRIETRFDFKP